MRANVITITGYSCAGKSTIVQQLKNTYNCEIMKFGQIHKLCTRENGYDYAKDWIREKGFCEYEEALVKTFALNLKNIIDANRLVIIDGIFSSKCFEYMKMCECINLINIVIDTSYGNRLRRMMNRERLTQDAAKVHLTTTDGIKARAGIEKIIAQPTYLIDGNMNIEQIENEFVRVIADISMVNENKRAIKKYNNIDNGSVEK